MFAWAGWSVLALAGVLAQATGVWLDVPFIRQAGGNGCAAACAAMVLGYWNGAAVETTEPELRRALAQEVDRPARAGDLARALEARGFRVFTFAGEMQDIEEHLAKGRPLVLGTRAGPRYHMVVAAGIDRSQGVLLVNDPAGRKLQKVDLSDFTRRWEATGRWTLLAVPRDAR